MGWWCKGCGQNRQRITPPYQSCKGTRLCKIVSSSALLRHPNKSLYWYRSLEARLAHDHVLMNALICQSDFPNESAAFVELIRRGHARLFNAEPQIAGRFRFPSEPVQFGTGSCQWNGTEASQIETDLTKLWQHVAVQICSRFDKDRTAQIVAFFLEWFFLIHPFVDGNGRIGRAVSALIVRQCGSYDLQVEEPRLNSKQRRKYVKALNYAHLRNPHSFNQFDALRERKPFDARSSSRYLEPLINVVRKWIIDVPDDATLEEAAPPLSAPDSPE
jgi:fido (protein-threonine AMPylation protein)